jgi:hypothetical protein
MRPAIAPESRASAYSVVPAFVDEVTSTVSPSHASMPTTVPTGVLH